MPATTAVSHGPDGPRVTVSGAVDVASSPGVGECLTGLMDGGATSLTIDLAGVHFMDSTGVHVLNVARKRSDDAGGTVTLLHVTAQARRVIDLLGMAPHFEIVDDAQGGTSLDPSG